MLHVHEFFTKPVCKFVDDSARGTSSARTIESSGAPSLRGHWGIGALREPQVVGENQRLLEAP